LILPKDRDPRFITVRRGGTLQDSDHRLLAGWAADCAEHVLHLFEAAQPADARPRQAIQLARAWVRGEVTMTQARTAAGHAQTAARDLSGAARHAAYAAGQASAVAHIAAHELGTAAYAIKSVRAAVPDGEEENVGRLECQWQRDSCRRRFATLSWTISGCEMISAGRCSTPDEPSACVLLPTSHSRISRGCYSISRLASRDDRRKRLPRQHRRIRNDN
jgi:ribosomal protein L37AE/L43A